MSSHSNDFSHRSEQDLAVHRDTGTSGNRPLRFSEMGPGQPLESTTDPVERRVQELQTRGINTNYAAIIAHLESMDQSEESSDARIALRESIQKEMREEKERGEGLSDTRIALGEKIQQEEEKERQKRREESSDALIALRESIQKAKDDLTKRAAHQKLQEFVSYAEAGAFPEDAFSIESSNNREVANRQRHWAPEKVKDLITDWNEPRTFEQLGDIFKELLQNEGRVNEETRRSLLESRDKSLTSNEIKILQGMTLFVIEDIAKRKLYSSNIGNLSRSRYDYLHPK